MKKDPFYEHGDKIKAEIEKGKSIDESKADYWSLDSIPQDVDFEYDPPSQESPKMFDLVSNTFLLVDNTLPKGRELSNVIGCFDSDADAILWAEINLDHTKYNVYSVRAVL
jgi:hypothetical protein